MAQDFGGRTAIVTGGGSGIGRAVCEELAERGANVVVADLDEAGARETAEAVGGHVSVTDTTDPQAVEAMVTEAVDRTGGLHMLVNNAGIGGASAPTGSYPVDSWEKVIAVNLSGVFYGCRFGIPAIKASGGGAVVNMASILGSVGIANSVAYVAAKHGVVGLTKSAALEHAADKVRVNAVGPGFVQTRLLDDNLDDETKQYLAGLHAARRLGEPREVSALTCFLLSDAASFVTGSYHLVDGGYTAQ